MPHNTNPQAEELLDQELPVLDHGFVRLVDYMGDDARIVQAARVSYGEGTKTVRQDKGLIDYLLRHDHTSPFEQVVFTFHLKMPIFVARQWIRHRTARMNEISGRYSVMRDEFFVPDEQDVHLQSETNRQGRDESRPADPDVAREIVEEFRADQERLYRHYETMIERGISRELARVNLPLALYTEFYWQMDLHNLFHFLRLRADSHAQLEIRLYAETVGRVVKVVVPYAWESFERHVLNGCRLGAHEIAAVKNLIDGKPTGLSERARAEFDRKLGIEKDGDGSAGDAGI